MILMPASPLSAVTVAAPLGFFAGLTGVGSQALWVAIVPVEAILFCSRSVAVAAVVNDHALAAHPLGPAQGPLVGGVLAHQAGEGGLILWW